MNTQDQDILKTVLHDQKILISTAYNLFGSHAAVARKLGITRQSYHRYVAGERLINLYQYYALKKLVRLPVEAS
jgi:lipopolysaccharide biosynthesis glycosyltransferase